MIKRQFKEGRMIKINFCFAKYQKRMSLLIKNKFDSRRCDYEINAAIAALAICASSDDLTPLTPTAPTQ